jgi:hypothetical protein
LTALGLTYNSIGDEGAKAFLYGLEYNTSLKNFNIVDNAISGHLIVKINDMLKSNKDGSRVKKKYVTPLDRTEDAKSQVMANPMIATSRDNLKDVMLKPDSEPTDISLEYIVECTNNFAEDRFLGRGAFGAVYKGVDIVTQYQFAVKRVPFAITDQDTLDGIQLSFRKEITVCFNMVATVSLPLVHY